jgi:MFS family permease
LDPRLFQKHGFATGSASLFLQFFALYGFFFVALQFLQLVLGYSTLISAVALLPAIAVMLPLATVAATLAERYGQRIVGSAGLLVAAAGFAVLALMTASSGYGLFVVGLVLTVIGASLAMTPATNAIIGSLPRAKQGVASAVNDAARELGSAFGVALLGSAFYSAYRGSIDARHAFMTGSRAAMLIGTALLVVGATYVALRGTRATANEPDLDDALDGADETTLAAALDAAPAFSQGQAQ